MSDIYYQYFTMRFRPQQKKYESSPSYDEGKSVFLQKSATIVSRTKTEGRRGISLSDSVQFLVTQER